MKFYFESIKNDLDIAELNCGIELDRAILYLEYYNNVSNIYNESAQDHSDWFVESENNFKNTINAVIEAIKEFFKKIHQAIKEHVNKLRGRIEKAYTTEKLRDVLNDFEDKVERAEKFGIKKVKFFDIEAAYKTFSEETQEYCKIMLKYHGANRILYEDDEIERLPEKFEEIHNKYDKKLLEILNTKKEYPIRDAKILMQKIEIDRHARAYGFLDVLDIYDRTCDKVEKFLENVLKQYAKMKEEEKELEEKHPKVLKSVNSIKSSITKATQFIHTHSGMCITALVAAVVAVGATITVKNN